MAHHQGIAINKRQLAWLLLCLLALYVVVPQLGGFQHSLRAISQARLGDVVLAVGFTVLTYLAAAGTYCSLAFHHLHYPRTVLVEVASMFVNRLLPAGIGAIGVNYAYLRRNRHSPSQAAGVVALNNGVGIFGHLLLVAVLSVAYRVELPTIRLYRSRVEFIAGIVLIVVAVAMAAYLFYGQRLRRGARAFWAQLLSYRRRPARLLAALLCSVSLTLSNLFCLWFCASSVGAGVSFIAVVLIFTFGVAVGTATPSPGGLGGVEAGLVAGLVAYHVSDSTALAAVLLFRLITYWLPLLAGSLAFVASQRRHYLSVDNG